MVWDVNLRLRLSFKFEKFRDADSLLALTLHCGHGFPAEEETDGRLERATPMFGSRQSTSCHGAPGQFPTSQKSNLISGPESFEFPNIGSAGIGRQSPVQFVGFRGHPPTKKKPKKLSQTANQYLPRCMTLFKSLVRCFWPFYY